MIEALARQVPTWNDDLRLIDSTPLPCAASRETVKRSDLAGHCGYGYCRSHSRFFWGFRLYLVTTAEGMPVTWCLASPKIGEREVMAALLERDRHLVRAGRVILADKGLAGKEFEGFCTERLGVHLVGPDRRDRLGRGRREVCLPAPRLPATGTGAAGGAPADVGTARVVAVADRAPVR